MMLSFELVIEYALGVYVRCINDDAVFAGFEIFLLHHNYSSINVQYPEDYLIIRWKNKSYGSTLVKRIG